MTGTLSGCCFLTNHQVKISGVLLGWELRTGYRSWGEQSLHLLCPGDYRSLALTCSGSACPGCEAGQRACVWVAAGPLGGGEAVPTGFLVPSPSLQEAECGGLKNGPSDIPGACEGYLLW